MNSDINKQIGKRLKELRESKSLTRKELSAKLNVSEGCLEKWESGDREIGTENLYSIANLFNVDFNYLYGFESKKDDKPQFNGYKNIGRRLRQRREELGYSRSELEKKCSFSDIEKIELENDLRGCIYGYEGFMRLAEALKISFDELIWGKEPDKFVENEFTKKREAELVFDGVIDTKLFGGCDSPEFVKYLMDKHCITPREKLIETYKAGEYGKIRQYFVDCEYYDRYRKQLTSMKDEDLLDFILTNYVPMPACHGIEIDDYYCEGSAHSYSEEDYKAHLIEKRRKIFLKSLQTACDCIDLNKLPSDLEECYSKKQYSDVQYILYKRLCYKLYWFFEGKLEWFKNVSYGLEKKYPWFNGDALDFYDKFCSIKSVPKDIDKNFRYLLKVKRDQTCELTEEQLRACEKFIINISAFY